MYTPDADFRVAKPPNVVVTCDMTEGHRYPFFTVIGRKNREMRDHTYEGMETAMRGMEGSGRPSADYTIGLSTETYSSC
jgi:hypothetical protein